MDITMDGDGAITNPLQTGDQYNRQLTTLTHIPYGSSVLIRFLKTLIQTKVLGFAVDSYDCQVVTGADAIY